MILVRTIPLITSSANSFLYLLKPSPIKLSFMQHILPLTAPKQRSERNLPEKVLRNTLLLLFGLFAQVCLAQAPSHDPTSIVENTDGRYWIFTTGDGVWAMSASDQAFTDWRPETTPFTPGTWPDWISSYVPDFAGTFWAPGVIQMNGYYYLYYSASTFGSSRSAIGVTRASDLNGPWTDLGVVVSSNGSGDAINAIDPALFEDTDGRVYMSYGSWFGGLAVVEIDAETGKATGPTSPIAGGNHQSREAPYIMKDGDYYYLFSNRGTCCDGLNSSYYIVVSRATDVRGPYTGERTFIYNQTGNIVGPGHFGYADGWLTYHYYDGYANGAARLVSRSDFGFADGWPYIGPPPSGNDQRTVYQLQNRGTGLLLDGMGRTEVGAAVGQSVSTTHANAQWELIEAGGDFRKLRNVGTGLFLDGGGGTTNGSDAIMVTDTTNDNSDWSVRQFAGEYQRLQNRATSLFLDGMGRAEDGANAGQWANTTSSNAQWELIALNVDGPTSTTNRNTDRQQLLKVYPNPVADQLTIMSLDSEDIVHLKVLDTSGKPIVETRVNAPSTQINVGDWPQGMYIIEASSASGIRHSRFLRQH